MLLVYVLRNVSCHLFFKTTCPIFNLSCYSIISSKQVMESFPVIEFLVLVFGRTIESCLARETTDALSTYWLAAVAPLSLLSLSVPKTSRLI